MLDILVDVSTPEQIQNEFLKFASDDKNASLLNDHANTLVTLVMAATFGCAKKGH